MKKVLYLLMFLTIITNCFSQETEQLPDKPWKDIVEIYKNKNETLVTWGTDVRVKLEGSYTQTDSLAVAKILNKLDALTETISIYFSKFETPNFIITFSKVTQDPHIEKSVGVDNNTGELIEITTSRVQEMGESSYSEKGYFEGSVIINKNDKYLDYRKSLEPRIAKMLVGGSFFNNVKDDKRNSIFNYKNRDSALSSGDKAIIKAVYSPNFEKHLEKAGKQFANLEIKIAKNDKITNRDKSLWWVNNPHGVLVLPTIILLLVFVFIIIKINHSLSSKLKNEWLRFAIVIFIASFFLDVLLVLYSYFYSFLTIKISLPYSLSWGYRIIEFTGILIISFPFMFLLRFIEIQIRKSTQQIFVKTILIFLSTGFLPFIALIIIVYFTDGLNKSNSYQYAVNTLALSQAFLYLMLIASVRALISYFIFKERNLIIENETKLSNLRELKTKAELKSLQSQINPHFLYNSLNSIASLAPIDAKKTQKMAYSLSDLFKYSINRRGKKMSSVFDEVDMVKTYLEIEKIRFGDRLQFTIDVDKDIENNEIPMFLIQPLVENAIKHGISKNEGEGKIVIKIVTRQSNIIITVADNGPNFPEGLVSGHGLQTVYDLLRLTYGDKATLNWTNTPEKMIIITIPKTI